MAVEQLLQRQINARDFHPVEEKPKSKAELMFERLKETQLYDKKENKWYECTSPSGTNKTHPLQTQLYGILIEAKFNNTKANEDFENIQNNTMYERELRQWDQQFLANQFIGIVIEGMLDQEKAKKRYEKLKQTKYYNETEDVWRWHEVENQPGNAIYANSLLLEILAEGTIDKDKALSKYIQLKQSPLYENATGQWNLYMDAFGNVSPQRNPTEQLFGVLVETMFDKEKARRSYEALKGTELFYDKQQKQWSNMGSSVHYSRDQLLGILIEEMLGQEETLVEKPVPIPQMRKF